MRLLNIDFMKKIKLIAAFVAMFGAIGASAQSFNLDKDTSKAFFAAGSGNTDVKIKVSNVSSSTITLNWKVANYHLDPSWQLIGLCDNVSCYDNATTGLISGMSSFPTDVIAPSASFDFKMTLNGDAAADFTKAYATVELSEGATKKYGTFYAFKTSAGITNKFLQDNDIAIYPNPAQNYIDVVYSPSSDVKTIAIYNLIGKAVSVYKVTDKSSARCEFNAEMPSGIYVVRVADSKGAVIATRKITRQ